MHSTAKTETSLFGGIELSNLDTWLSFPDLHRILEVVDGTIPEGAATVAELEEFSRLITIIGMKKLAGTDLRDVYLN